MTIWAHTLFKNEANWLWYSVCSVVNHVDKILLWDTGSTDGSWEIARLIQKKYPDKVELKQYGEVSVNDFPLVRQKMLERTKADWILIVDGDEVWWEDSISKLVGIIKNDKNGLEMIVNKNINPVGDIFHILPQTEGKYLIDENKGFLNIRAMSLKINGLHAKGEHGVQGYYDQDEKLIQLRDKNKRLHCDYGYMHLTNLKRSKNSFLEKKVPKRANKYKYEIGKSLATDFYFPESFFKEKPKMVSSPWKVRSNRYLISAFFQRPLKIIKNIFNLHKKYGY